MSNVYLETLKKIEENESQKRALEINGSTLVKAGPGSGKTTILAMKAYKLNERVSFPRKIACLTYSNEAVNSLGKKIKSLNSKNIKGIYIGTLHSFCLSVLLIPFKKSFKEYGIPEKLMIISEDEKKEIMEEIKYNFGIPKKMLSITDVDKERRIHLGSLSKVKIPSYDIAKKVAQAYEERLEKEEKLDFERIISISLKLIQNEEYIQKYLEAKFPWLLIDEYQDLGRPLHEIVLTLLNKTSIKFFIVGDPDQSIYGFQGALPDFFYELGENKKVEEISLLKNYRSNENIVNSFDQLLERKNGYQAVNGQTEKEVFNFIQTSRDLESQYDYLEDILLKELLEEYPPEEILIMVNANNNAKILKERLESKDYACYISKYKFNKSELILWILGCVRWTLEKPGEHFSELFDKYVKIMDYEKINEYTIEKKRIYILLNNLRCLRFKPEEWISRLLVETGVEEKVKGTNQEEVKNIKELKEELFSNIPTLDEIDETLKKGGKISIMTRHSSKGLEYGAIIMLGMEEESFPHYYSIKDPQKLAEEKRLFFVAISRAKERCYLICSKQIGYYEKKPSRFLIDLLKYCKENDVPHTIKKIT